jgi:hypothetical protein
VAWALFSLGLCFGCVAEEGGLEISRSLANPARQPQSLLSVKKMSRQPTLGCQIAPSYNHEEWPYDSESSTSDGSGGEEIAQEQVAEGEADIEKIETIQEMERTYPTPSRNVRPVATVRTKSSRKAQVQAEEPVGFWHYKMAGVRLHVLKLWFRTNFILSVAIMAFLCLFWGALFRQDQNLHNLSILVVDFDGQPPFDTTTPFVGPFVTHAVQSLLDAGHTPGYTFRSSSDFSNDPLKVREAVYDFKAWAAIIVNPNATALLDAAIRTGHASYDPLGACQIIYNSARDQTTSASYILPSLTSLQKHAVSTFGAAWIRHVLQQNISITPELLVAAPQALSPGIEFTTYDLRPFGPPIATPAVSIGLIYLIIISFFSFTFFLPIHLKYLSPRGHPPLKFRQLIAWRYIATVSSYFLLSLVYSFVSLAFLMPMTNGPASHVEPRRNPNAYGQATFVVYWILNWIGMTAFGLASENAAMILGTPWTALWLIFWVISNVATGFYALELAPGFYKWGYAWPMHNIVEMTRSVLFDLHPRVGRNLGVLVAWCVVDTLLFPVCCYYMRWKSARAKRNAARKEAEWQRKMEKEREEPSRLARITTVGTRA